MIISLSWLRELVDVKASAEDISDKLSVSGLEVEHSGVWESVKGGLKGFVIGQVLECSKHPNADKLSVTRVDIGSGEPQPIVCGAPNVAAGQKVVVATPGTVVTVPGKGTFTIGEAKIRGEVSRGMICAEDEMGLGTSHEGILVLPEEAPLGMAAADYFKVFSDEILDIGLTANRGDAASHLGVARDVAALFNAKITLPEVPARPLATGKVNITISKPEHCSTYIGLSLKGLQVRPSGETMQNRLKAIGIEPKNILVDATNYVLHSLGQPIHAFDADKLRGNAISVREAVKGETFTTLDKVQRECKGGELVIADNEGPVAFAGVMGGLETAVSENTTCILIESAHFHPGMVRKTARAHGLNTDASFRFERSTDPLICRMAALYCADLIMAVAGGEIEGINQVIAKEHQPVFVNLDTNKLSAFAGAEIPADVAVRVLSDLGFGVTGSAPTLKVEVPSWRSDVSVEADLYEEVMRIFGYDQIPITGKMNVSLPVFKGIEGFRRQEHASRFLNARGFFEIMNNSLTSDRFYDEATLKSMVSLTNPLSSDMEYMRASMLPGMLQAAAYNRNRKLHNIRFFEFGRLYAQADGNITETDTLCLLYGGDRTEESWESKPAVMDYYYGKSLVEGLLKILGVRKAPESYYKLRAVTAAEKKQSDVEGDFWFAEVYWPEVLRDSSAAKVTVAEPPKFPFMRRDLSLVVDRSMAYDRIKSVIEAQKLALLKKVTVFDVFEGKPLDEGKKAIAIALYFGKDDETLTDEVADGAMNELIAACEKAGALIRR